MANVKKAKESAFNSKILLFGEYSIIQNSMGLSIPYDSFTGQLSYLTGKKDSHKAVKSNKDLLAYLDYIKGLEKEGKLLAGFNIKKFEKDIKKGLYFESTIPQGFGVGSSGALVAALYDHYVIDKLSRETIKSNQILKLKKVFAQLESFYHGKSSGIDPLICYLDLPILIKSKSSIGTVDLPKTTKGQGAIFLLDTGRPGRTQPLVQWFLEKCKQKDFVKKLDEHFIPYNDQCIKDFLKGETKELFYNLYYLSEFLLEYLHPMIPKLFRKLWQKGLETKAFYLKLCGSGGGGFLLGFTEDLEVAQQYLQDHKIKVIHKF